MNVFADLKTQIESFKATREHILAGATLPELDGDVRHGSPPFAIDDGTNYYAVIDEDGTISPLPFGYEIAPDDIAADDADCIFSVPMAVPGSGMEIARYVPLVEDFINPGDRAFCLESAEDSSAWETVGKVCAEIQQRINEKTQSNFNRNLSNALVRIYDGWEAFESVEQAIAALMAHPSLFIIMLIRAYQDALDEFEEALHIGEDDEL